MSRVTFLFLPIVFGYYVFTQYTCSAWFLLALFIYYAIYKYHWFQVNREQIERVSKYLFENVHEGVMLFDADGNVIQVNTAAKAIVGNDVAATPTVETVARCIDGYDFQQRIP